MQNNNLNVNEKICKNCGGTCCQSCGCHFSPKDFREISLDYLKKAIEERGYISIDVVPKKRLGEEEDIYILRARNDAAPVVDLGHRWISYCMLLTENGCKISYEERPMGGKMLIPEERGEDGRRRCKQLYPIEQCAADWKKYQEILISLIEIFKEK